MDILIGFAVIIALIIFIGVVPNMASNIKTIMMDFREFKKYFYDLQEFKNKQGKPE